MTYEPSASSSNPPWQQPRPLGAGSGPQSPQLGAAPAPRKRNPLWLIIGIAAGVLVLCCGGLATLGAIVGPPKKTAANSSAGATQTHSTTPTAAFSSAAAGPAAPSNPTKSAASTPAAAPTAAAPPNYAAAAAILLADDEHYRGEIAAGPPVLGTPAFTAWWQTASTDVQNEQDFSKADAYFTADNEPTDLLEAWRTDNGNAVTDVYQFASAELKAGPGPATAEMHTWELAFQADIAKADADAKKLQAMH